MHSSLQLGMFFLEELATSSSFGDKTIPTDRVRAVTACHALGSTASRSEFFYQV